MRRWGAVTNSPPVVELLLPVEEPPVVPVDVPPEPVPVVPLVPVATVPVLELVAFAKQLPLHG
jgi:hypothetical protein